MAEDKNYFEVLNSINVSDKTEKKGKLTYLSWTWAWAEIKKRHPDANYKIYERPDGVNYWTDGRTCWVKTGVTVDGIEHIEYLPIMDFNNRSIPLEKVTSMEVNKAIQRSITKACARHGLGLYIYSGEDFPEETDGATQAPKQATRQDSSKQSTIAPKQKLQTAQQSLNYSSGKREATQNKRPVERFTTNDQLETIRKELKRTGVGEEKILDRYHVSGLGGLTERDAADAIKGLAKTPSAGFDDGEIPFK